MLIFFILNGFKLMFLGAKIGDCPATK